MVKNHFNCSQIGRLNQDRTEVQICFLLPCLALVELNPPVPFASRLLNTRTMKDTFRSFVELLIGVALNEDVMTELERTSGKSPKDSFQLGI